SRHGRLGTRTAGAFPRHGRRDGAARLAQHDGGRAPVRARHHHEARPHRGRRYARAPARALRARHARRRVPRRRSWPRPCGGGFAMTSASLTRIGAMVRRYWYLLRSSWPRILDLIYWPTVQMLMWGFLQSYVASNAGFFARAGGVFIGSVLLWDI